MWLCRVHHIQIYHNDWHQPSWSNSEQHQFLEKRIYLKQKDWHLMSGICGNIRVTNNLADQRIPLFEAFCHITTFYDVHLNLFPGSSSELWWDAFCSWKCLQVSFFAPAAISGPIIPNQHPSPLHSINFKYSRKKSQKGYITHFSLTFIHAQLLSVTFLGFLIRS